MLVLKRQNGEAVKIDKDIKITIFYRQGKEVRVGIDAPKNINIVRKELVTDKIAEK